MRNLLAVFLFLMIFSLPACASVPKAIAPNAGSISGTVSTANGGTGTSTTFTQGSVVFAGPSGIYTQDNAKLFWDNTNFTLGIGTASPNTSTALDMSATTGSMLLPVGTTGQRPGTGVNGMLRYNSTTPGFEGYANGTWGPIGGGTGSALTSGTIWVGNGSNLAAAVTPSLDVSLATNGAVTVNSYGGGNVPGSACAANTGTSGGTVPLLNSNSLSFTGTGDNFTNPIAIGTTTVTTGTSLDLGTNTNSMLLPVGTNGQRPTGVNGMIRYNSTSAQAQAVEGFIDGAWQQVSPVYPVDSTAGGSIGFGISALSGQTSSAGYGSTAFGYNAMGLAAMTTAALQNTAFGNSALARVTTGQRNTMVGAVAGDYLSTGQFNSCLGRTVCGGATTTALTGNDNTGMGDSTLANIQGAAADNTAYGFKAGNAITAGTQNTMIGSNAGLITTGGNNTIIGYNVASTTLTTGTGNILIGTSNAVTTPAAGTASWLNIGNGLICDLNTPTVSSGFGTSPSIPNNKGNCSFSVNVGTGGSASSGVLAFTNAAPNAWNCTCSDTTTTSSTVFLCKSANTSTTSVTLTNYNTSGAAAAWAASDVLEVKCMAR